MFYIYHFLINIFFKKIIRGKEMASLHVCLQPISWFSFFFFFFFFFSFSFQFCEARWTSANHPKEDLAKFG